MAAVSMSSSKVAPEPVSEIKHTAQGDGSDKLQTVESGQSGKTVTPSVSFGGVQAFGGGDGTASLTSAESGKEIGGTLSVSALKSSHSTRTTMRKLPKYEGPNPFGRRIKPGGCWETCKKVFFTVTLIAPIRIFLVIALACSMAIFSIFATCGHNASKPMTGLRLIPSYFMRMHARVILFILGLYWVNVRGRYDKSARVLVCNHVSIFDALYLYVQTGSCEAAKSALFSNPLIGTILRGMQCVEVKRDSQDGRDKAKEQMMDHCTNPKWPPFLIFPQGTTAREDTLTTFKNGAFDPGLPIQPVCVRYMRNRFNSLEFTETMLWQVYEACCQFINFQEVIFLDVYEPDEDEIAHPGVFAENIRRLMAETLQAELTPHSYDDVRLRRETDIAMNKKGESLQDPGFIMGDIFNEFSVPTSKVIALLEIYKTFDHNGSGIMSFEDFCANTGQAPQNAVARRLFNLLDIHKTEGIEFEGFVSVMFSITTLGHEKDMLKVLWALVGDIGNNAHLSAGEGFEAVAEYMELAGAADLADRVRELGKKVPLPLAENMASEAKMQACLKDHAPEARELLKAMLSSQVKGLGAFLNPKPK